MTFKMRKPPQKPERRMERKTARIGDRIIKVFDENDNLVESAPSYNAAALYKKYDREIDKEDRYYVKAYMENIVNVRVKKNSQRNNQGSIRSARW